MKTQISRNANQPDKAYSGVYQQQGRMITDADWNALTDIEKQRLVDALKDMVASGMPADGGLELDATEAGLMIKPGRIYVDGVPAGLTGESFPVADQPDYPGAPDFSGQNLQIYADVWERTVTALEDPDLMDPALHGADTTTRSQTMLQIKWCDTDIDLGDRDQLPALGTAGLALRLRRISVADDPCDPCASEMNLDERVGNYLFRVEVHDRDQRDGKDEITLKWSRDNGAEAYAVDNFPPGFDRGDWVWEFFDTNTEKRLGHHFLYPSNEALQRGVLTDEFAVPEADGEPTAFVRQWDGYAVIDIKNGTLIEGYDRGNALSESASSDAHGFVGFDGGRVTINGERLEMILAYETARFLPGDYWQAPVRETEQGPGSWVLGSQPDESMPPEGEPPVGVQHHYLKLRELDNEGNLRPLSDAEDRRFTFPPLTDIPASHVSFQDNCEGLFHGAENVQQALYNLCSIGAEDIAYEPACESEATVAGLLAGLLERWPDLDDDGKVTVEDMLDALLCHHDSRSLPHEVPECDSENSVRQLLKMEPGPGNTAEILNRLLCQLNATHIPLDRKQETLCPELAAENVVSVQDALAVLCAREGRGGCAIAVQPGELESVLRTLIQQEAADIWLCLKPGVHELPKGLDLKAARHIRITGAGYHASQIRLDDEQWRVEAPEIHLADVGIQWGDNVLGQLNLQADILVVQRVQLVGEPNSEWAMLYISPLTNQFQQLLFQDNRILSRSGVALRIGGPIQTGYIERNYCTGEVHYNPNVRAPMDPVGRLIHRSRSDADYVRGAGLLHLQANAMVRWVSFIESGAVDEKGTLVSQLQGMHSLSLQHNYFTAGSSFVAYQLVAEGNHIAPGKHDVAILLLATRLVAQGNLGDSKQAMGRLTANEDVVASNLMDLRPLDPAP